MCRSDFLARLVCLPGALLLWLALTLPSCQALDKTDDNVRWGEWSPWSACSALCDSGISSRSRNCKTDNSQAPNTTETSEVCHGASSQTKVCKLKECPPDQPSARQEACSKYDKRVFSGKQYVWEPFVHPTDPCKLSCQAKGHHFYANLADMIVDGTPCGSEMAKAVCVKGVCKEVGCDGVIDSASRLDKCGVCNGDQSTCRTISGIFTSTELKRGLNYVISIPPGSTNINITELQTSRNLLLLQTVTGKTFINGGTSSPTSGNVTAAGTVFTYGAKSLSNTKETITSPGPTNETVVLKLLLRGLNGGILYTFNVPTGVSEKVIQQIKHHSRPVELPPETSRERGQGGHSRLPLQTLRPKSRPKEPLVGRAGDRFDETVSLVGSLEILQGKPSNVAEKDIEQGGQSEGLDQTSPGSFSTEESPLRELHGNHHSNGPLERIAQTSQPVAIPQSSPSSVNQPVDREHHNNDVETPSLIISNSEQTEEDSEEIFSDESTSESRDHDLVHITDYSQQSLGTTDSESNSEEFDNSSEEREKLLHDRNRELVTDDDKIKDVLKDHKIIHFFNDSFYANEDHVTETPEQSFSIPIGSIVDPNEIEEWDPDGNNEEVTKEQSQSPFASSGDVQTFTGDTGDEEDNGKGGGESVETTMVSSTTQMVRQATTQKSNVIGSDMASTRESSPDVDSSSRRDGGLNKQRKHANRAGSNSARRGQLRKTHSFYNPKDSSYYRIPKYSQSFTFAERYKNIYDSKNSQTQSRRRFNRRHRHHRNQLEHEEQAVKKGNVEIISRVSGGTPHTTNGSSSVVSPRRPVLARNPSRYEEDGQRGNKISAFGSPDNRFTGSRRGSRDRQQNDRHDHANRRRRLRDREALREERRRRIEEQRNRYQERMREYREKVRQRQAEIEASRRRGSTVDGGTSNWGSHESVSRDSGSFTRTHLRPSSLSSNQRRHGDLQPHDDTYYLQPSLGAPSRPVQPAILPRVIQPPETRNPQFHEGSRNGGDPARIIPRFQPSEPQYVPSPSSSSFSPVSALGGNELPFQQPHTRGSNVQYIPTNQFPSEELPAPNQDGPSDALRNQIPLNTLTTDEVARRAAYEWRISGLTECTHSCGGGAQQTIAVCVDSRTQAVITDENCQQIRKPKQLAISCNTRPCPAQWTPSPWTSCSVTCGQGEQTRTVVCQARVSPTLNLTMPNSSCEGQESPSTKQSCINSPCSSWRVSNWTDCSAPCGDGQRTREIHCTDLKGNVVPEDTCTELRPSSEEQCNLGECGKGWFFTEWPEECPAECGSGEATRKIFCANEAGIAVPEARCNETQRPAETRSCRSSRPCGGLWFTGEWSKCDATCGQGNRRRDVLCIKELPGHVFAVVGDENCQGVAKPVDAESCQLPVCVSQWYMTSWTQCSQSCGTGYRTREVKCLDPDQKPSDHCPLHKRPKKRDVCNTHDCASAQKEDDPECVDKFAQCRVVKRARLCRYAYYKTTCCKSCSSWKT